MNYPSTKKIILSWVLESILILLQFITFFLFIPLPKYKKENKGTILIITDILTPPFFYLLLRFHLQKKGFNIYFFYCYNPFKKLLIQSKKLSNFILKQNETNITIIGHGFGGLLPLSINDEARKKIRRIITLDTPFWGTQLANYLKFLPAFKDILPRSEYLITYKMNVLLYEEFYPFVAWQDQWIFPENLLKFGQGRDIIMDIPGRLNLILHIENVQTLIQFLEQFFAPKTIQKQYKTEVTKKRKKS